MNAFPLLDLQDQVAAELERKAFFQDVNILSERKGDLASRVQAAQNKLAGLWITILTLKGTNEKPAVEGPRLTVDVLVMIGEKVALNRIDGTDYKTVTALVTEAASALHLFTPGAASSPLQFRDFSPAPAPDNQPGTVVLALRFTTTINLKPNATY